VRARARTRRARACYLMGEPADTLSTVQGPAEVMKGTPRQAAMPPGATASSGATASKIFFLSGRRGNRRRAAELG
jgi:hypothetical protein